MKQAQKVYKIDANFLPNASFRPCLKFVKLIIFSDCLNIFSIKLGNGETGTDVRVRNNRLHCQNCYSNDEGNKTQGFGVKFHDM